MKVENTLDHIISHNLNHVINLQIFILKNEFFQ
jgi:hypothetical protein